MPKSEQKSLKNIHFDEKTFKLFKKGKKNDGNKAKKMKLEIQKCTTIRQVNNKNSKIDLLSP